MGRADKEITFLGKNTEFEGKLRFEGALRIDGYYKGEITSDGNLVVGEDALVEGDMHVSYVVVSGEVHGNIVADQRADLRAPAKVFGNILAPAVVIDEGVIFEGHTRMYRARQIVEEGDTPVIGSDEYKDGPPVGLTAIYGIVTDQESGRPVKNAKIKCKGSEKKQIETNASGYYEFISLKEGEWKLKIEAKGYKKEKSKIVISGAGTHRQNFELRPKK